ncbi:MAG: MBL fold metallo-hydrolase [Deltaproteobacteria bacterium]|nr:MBL fold metallo-hydrolase [Deltaproteobacteria bacterium]
MSVAVTIVVDNSAPPHLAAEHGFAAWIETAGRRILFDTGQGDALRVNVPALRLPLERTDAVVLSHGHYDHTGGLPYVLEAAPGVVVHAHPAVAGPHYAVRDGRSRWIGLSPAARDSLQRLPAARRPPVAEAKELAPGVGLTGPIPRETPGEDTGGPFFLDPEGTRPDPLEDDLALWVRTKAGLVVVVGCSHAGLVNTLRHARTVSGETRLRAALGGFHLLAADDRRLAHTARTLLELDPERVVPCHCTGERAVERLARTLGERLAPGAAGMTFRFD